MHSWLTRSCDRETWQEQVTTLLGRGYLNDCHPWVIGYDLDLLQERVEFLQGAFPDGTLHTSAIKANPLPGVLKLLVECGMGLEVASPGELELAFFANCSAEKMVFDSPAKTVQELKEAVSMGVTINANSELELQRLSDLKPRGRVGLRCNPGVIAAARATATSTAAPGSKFGVEQREAEELLKRYPFVSGLHVHVGSQMATLEDLVEGTGRVLDLAERFPQIEWLDIGGGLPARYTDTDQGVPLATYLGRLQQRAPGLQKYRLITEIGRALHANCAWAASLVEYVAEGKAILHFGADFCLRECYQPEHWWHEISVLTSNGEVKRGPTNTYDLYGPLCFSGDRVASRRELPTLEPGDVVVMHDVGAYTLSMWSRYCSRLLPEVVGFQQGRVRVLRKRETPGEIVKFWTGNV